MGVRECAYCDRGGVQFKASHSDNSMNWCLIVCVIVSVDSSPIFYRHCFALLAVNSTRPLIVMNMSPQSQINLYVMLSYFSRPILSDVIVLSRFRICAYLVG